MYILIIAASVLTLGVLVHLLISGIVRRPRVSIVVNIGNELSRDEAAIAASSPARAIVLASAAALFAELAMIRLLGSYLQLFAYLKNISLLACFLGLGLGFMLAKRAPCLIALHPPILLSFILFIRMLAEAAGSGVWRDNVSPLSEEHLLGMLFEPARSQFVPIAVIAAVFAWNAAVFLPLGQLVGMIMDRLAGVRAYRYNLLGSLCGIGLFSLLAHLWLGPAVWLVCWAALLAPFFSASRPFAVIALGSFLGSVIVVEFPGSPTERKLYSPYQTLTLTLNAHAPAVIASHGAYYQKILDLSDRAAALSPTLAAARAYYDFPYTHAARRDSVLILGSGTGNDVAAALRAGSRRIVAVEIDPIIADVGRRLHAEAPYQSARVSFLLTDARAYLRRGREQFDLVVYGLLDSHALSGARHGALRLDSYVYTVEAFREARRLLRDDGLLVLSFVDISADLSKKIFEMLRIAFDGRAPRVFKTDYDLAVTMIAGNGPFQPPDVNILRFRDITRAVEALGHEVTPSTDDWPYLYMPRKTVPWSYLKILACLLALSLTFIFCAGRAASDRFSWCAFFLGAAFMLLETKAFTELALAWGSTSQVTAVVIAVVLVVAYAANSLVERGRAPRPAFGYLLLLGSVVLSFASVTFQIENVPLAIEIGLRALLLTLPIFFAGVAFSREMERGAAPASILSANLVGAMCGGMLEYASMAYGFQALYLCIFLLYAAAFIASRRLMTQITRIKLL